MAPITEEMCGSEPSEMLKTLVSLGFKNTETLYTRLGLRDQLPDECIHLGNIRSYEDDRNFLTATVGAYRAVTVFSTKVSQKNILYQNINNSKREKNQQQKLPSSSFKKFQKSFVLILTCLLVALFRL